MFGKQIYVNVVLEQMPVLPELNESTISTEKVREVSNEIKSGKPAGLDRFSVESLKKCGAVLERLN